ncbi:MAG: fluoride efflux transporter CrcB [Nevskiaceae bacterium]|nr:MAG: fluoride efflux transporter CrcB [Nevskiaceae bacterium]TBR72698.1 MAG: fluoride efflux transporter CrcB [Nevskiaceae bacterium]
MPTYIAIAIGGTLGCWARYALTGFIQSIAGRSFPAATLCINVIGCLLMGYLATVTLERVVISPALRTGILTGGLGGFTTFSTFGMETLVLLQQGAPGKAVLYVAASVGLGITAAFIGFYLARLT